MINSEATSGFLSLSPLVVQRFSIGRTRFICKYKRRTSWGLYKHLFWSVKRRRIKNHERMLEHIYKKKKTVNIRLFFFSLFRFFAIYSYNRRSSISGQILCHVFLVKDRYLIDLSDWSNDFYLWRANKRKEVYSFFLSSITSTDNVVEERCVMNLSFSHACICICNRIHLVYVHSSSCQLSIVTHWQSKYLGLASFLQYSLCYYSFILFLLLSLRSRRAIRAKGLIILMSFYYDYIWLLCALFFPSFNIL
jgi:hypothetical protein